MRGSSLSSHLFVLALLAFAGRASAGDFVNFESSHVHPLAFSENGRWLYAVNTPEARVAIFRVRDHGRLDFFGDVPVGLEPVSLAVRPGTSEVWVANHLSDSVSVVDGVRRKLVATIPVGDEPTDVVFASGRAFVSLAGNRDQVRVYDGATREEVTSIWILGDDPRAIAASLDGTRVFVVALESGNRTATIASHVVKAGGGLPEPDPPPNPNLPPAPLTALIARFDPVAEKWRDETGKIWNAPVNVPDLDLFEIDAAGSLPTLVRTVSGVGTTLFDVAIHPQTGNAWVPNTDARNLLRFEPALRGHLVETRVSIIDFGAGSIMPIDLNPHIDYSITSGSPAERAASLAIPGDGVFSRDGSTFYLTAFGSGKVGILDGGSGAVLDRIQVGGGPSGVALNERARRLYVMNRFDNSISTVDLERGFETAVIGVAGPSGFDPSPPALREGRRFLYDGQLSSAHGDIACATCHVFAHFDGLIWDLGDPQGEFVSFSETDWIPIPTGGFHPMKGPMATQSLRGLSGAEPFHWRGDRRDLQHFNGAFVTLLGRAEPLPESQLDALSEFQMTVQYPPNPNRNLDDSLPDAIFPFGDPSNGEQLFRNATMAPRLPNFVSKCVSCHADPAGTDGRINILGDQPMVIAQLRGVYEKMNRQLPGPQKASLGPLHDGSTNLFMFLALAAPNFPASERTDVIAFLNAYPSETFPCVGHQETLRGPPTDDPDALSNLRKLIQQAEFGRCDLIASGVVSHRSASYAYDSELDTFQPDRAGGLAFDEPPIPAQFVAGDVLTYMGVPPGSGRRLGIDRDRDGCLDGDEWRHGDSADPDRNGCDRNSGPR